MGTHQNFDKLSSQRLFDLGHVHVEAWEACEHHLSHYLVYRVSADGGSRTLLASGSEHDLASCLERARLAARRVDMPA